MTEVGPHLLGRRQNHDPRSRAFAYVPRRAVRRLKSVSRRHYGGDVTVPR